MFYHPHPRVTFNSGTTLVTKQAFKAECDINNILKQYQRTGIISHVQNARPTYTDLPSDLDYQQSMNTLIAAQQAFDGLPSKVRDRFGNDPLQLLRALQDPDQADYLREVGILNPKEAPQGVPDPVRPPAGTPPAANDQSAA